MSKHLMAIGLATMAGTFLLEEFKNDKKTITTKEDGTFSIEIERAIEGRIIEELSKLPDTAKIVSEESGETKLKEEGLTWYVDPLDGTANFIAGIPFFCVSIAARYEGRLNIPHIGVIYDPIRKEVFHALKGYGAYLGSQKLKARPTAVGMFMAYEDAKPEIHDSWFAFRSFGTAALSLAWLAASRFDAVWLDSPDVWDYAAGEIIAEEAGYWRNPSIAAFYMRRRLNGGTL